MTNKAIAKGEEFLHTHDNVFHVKTIFYDSKIKTLFTRFDMDNNGKIEKEDFENWSSRLAVAGGLKGDRADALRKSIMVVWKAYFEPADTNHDGSVEFVELVLHMKSALRGVRDSHEIRQAILDTLPVIFDAVDTNGDGQIANDEFKAYFESLGINNEKFTNDVFKEMDTNNDRMLSKDEFVQMGFDFFQGLDNNSPSRFFFGPLVA